MATYSATDIQNEALGYLRVNEIGETPTSDEVAAVSNVLSELIAEWKINRVVDIDPTYVLPEHVQPAARLLANRCAPKFGRPGDPDLDMREQQRLRNAQTKYSRQRGVGAVAL